MLTITPLPSSSPPGILQYKDESDAHSMASNTVDNSF
eukprot:CAMPEP_0184291686 /NCGR_PEP_ID=MMETSP1049-20130417/3625_1 /TAXON_ID=77928 /ORGANISM="Proteomonas sulcata, Strain CCMP704" /LENGTH=36 /DNA_ID= /DNA_START= /DNA_END= /DNA_ORIENTATION=